MIKQITLWLLLLPVFTSHAIAQNNQLINLDQYQWKNRLVLVFAPSDKAKIYQRQTSLFKDGKKGLKDRDIKVFHLFADEKSFAGKQQINEKNSSHLYQRYNVKKGSFSVILIGKDGSEKLRTSEPLKIEKLFAVIDAMPMRQQEMKN